MADDVEGVPVSGASDGGTHIQTFLIADIRGYTVFTQERGDEAAGRLAARFAGIAREVVEARGGKLLELRGDEAVCVFTSPRRAIRAAVELQERFVEETLSDPELPLTAGIGLDAGEAVAVEGGYRGGALNLAARLCGQARAGEILASREVAHLARRVEGAHYEDRGTLSLKGLAEPVRVVRVSPRDLDAVARLQPYAQAPTPAPSRWRRPGWPAVAATALALVLVAVGLPRILSGDAGIDPQANSAAMIDAASGEIRFATALEGRPGAIATGFGSAWVVLPDRGQVVRLDASSGTKVDTIQVGEAPTGIATGQGSVWVTNTAGGTVSRISPDTNQVTQEIEVGLGPTGIAPGQDALWVADSVRNQLVRVDPSSGRVRPVDLPARPDAVHFTPEGVWVTSAGAATVSRVDPASLEITFEVTVGNEPKDVLPAFGSVWVANHLDGTVSRIDPATDRVTAIPVGNGPHSLAAADGSVWVANEFDTSVVALDASTDPAAVERRLDVGASVGPLSTGGDGIWVAVGESSVSHHGGTLRVVTGDEPATLDPGIAYDPTSWSLLTLTNDGLLAFRRVGGPEGGTIVPDLASALPEISDDGLSYRFELRSGIRYSTGEPVTPQDFRYALERTFRLSGDAAALFDPIPGAGQCNARPAACDLRDAVEIDGDTITIHLNAPTPDFPYLLTLPFTFPVPVGTPIEPRGFEPVPATGPYRVDSANKDRLVLVRNQAFREWAPGAQPGGFVDRIDWSFRGDLEEPLGAVLEGEVDVLAGFLPPDAVAEFQTAHPDQLVQLALASTMFVGLNPNVSPFDDERVRRAVNFAVDRERVQALFGGDVAARSTCQILPPGFPGYEPYCPYTRDRGGNWSEADLAEARRLVREAGAVGARVTYWTPKGGLIPGSVEVARYIARQLIRIGLDAELRSVPDIGAYFEKLGRSGRREIQMFDNGWFADYPGVSGYIGPLFRCNGPSNFQGFCDPGVDRAMRRAQRLALDDPTAAFEAWAEIDRRLVDTAAAVPLVNLVQSHAISDRVGNAQIHPQWGLLFSRLWVR